MTPETGITDKHPNTLRVILNTLSECAALVIDEVHFRNRKRIELKGIIIDEKNTKYEDQVCEALTKKLSERDSSPYNLAKLFSALCVPQFKEEAPELPFNYLRDDDIRSEGDKNLSNFQILRYRVWEKLSDNIPTIYRAHIIDIRRRFFDAPLDSR